MADVTLVIPSFKETPSNFKASKQVTLYHSRGSDVKMCDGVFSRGIVTRAVAIYSITVHYNLNHPR